MTRLSGFWTTDDSTPEGHQQASYTQVIAAKAWAILASCGGKEGVAPSYGNELACSSPTDYTVRVATGAAVVDGQWMYNDEAYDLTLDNTPTYRTDRIILRADWDNFILDVYALKGTDGSATPPDLTQTPGDLYELHLYDAEVVTGGAVTLTDKRSWAIVDVDNSTIEAVAGTLQVMDEGITVTQLATGAVQTAKIYTEAVTETKIGTGAVTAAKIANRTRTFLVPPLINPSETTRSYLGNGVQHLNNVSNAARGYFVVPSDFASTMTVSAIVSAPASGNVYAAANADYGAVGEAYNTHNATSTYSAVALTSNTRAAIKTLSLSSAAIDDYVSMSFIRDATNASDTISDDVYLTGWLVSYTADS